MTVFYRKYRPQKFSDLAGQDHIRESLLGQLTSGNISHGYLFAGPRGSGKTSTARIFAKAVNCLRQQLTTDQKQLTKKRQMSDASGQMSFSEPCNKCVNCLAITNGSFLDLIEIDAASNRGIDEIRDLREKIKLSPVSGRFKVYIIDEAHMLTTEAFNALLKTLEEPPKHAIFVLCTTAPAKLPLTIVSRLLRFNFKRAGDSEIIEVLSKIAKLENINVSDDAFGVIARGADGAFRDAVSILDQLGSSGKKITREEAGKVVSISTSNALLAFVRFLVKKDVKSAVVTLEKMALGDADFSLFTRDVVLLLDSVLLIKIGGASDLATEQFEMGEIEEIANAISFSDLQILIKLFLVSESEIKIYPLPKIPLILAVCKYCGDISESVNQSVSDSVDRGASESVIQKSETQKHRLTETPTHRNTDSPKHRLNKSIAQIESKWAEFLEKVRPVNVHILALLRSTRPVTFDGVNLTLEVFYKFHKEKLEEPKIRSMLEKLCEEVFGQKMVLHLKLIRKTESLPKVVSESDVIDVSGEDLAALAQEIFSK